MKVVPTLDHQSIFIIKGPLTKLESTRLANWLEFYPLRWRWTWNRVANLQLRFCDSKPCHKLLPWPSNLHQTVVMNQNLFFVFTQWRNCVSGKSETEKNWITFIHVTLTLSYILSWLISILNLAMYVFDAPTMQRTFPLTLTMPQTFAVTPNHATVLCSDP